MTHPAGVTVSLPSERTSASGGPEFLQDTGSLAADVLTAEALGLVADLHRRFDGRRRELLARRQERRAKLAAGATFDFLDETKDVRQDPDWRVAAPAPGLTDRRVEITGPCDPRMAVNALNSGARVWLADFEDATAPLFTTLLAGQRTLRAALDRELDFDTPEGRSYRLRPDAELPTVVVRPRGWHLPEKHVQVDGEPVSASLFDFAVHLVHCARALLDKGRGPYYYLPKLESHLEARLWNDVFVHAQEAVGLPRGTVRATCLIETYPAAFEMEEILYELREHSAGLNAGRWDYLFSVVKSFPTRDGFLLPDRNAVTMTAPFMRAYTELLVRTCHRRGAHAIGGMAAHVPNRADPQATEVAFAKVRADKTREANDGFDGSWVAHPDMVGLCREVFSEALGDRPNQLDRLREDVSVTAQDLLDVDSTPGEVTWDGLRGNVSVGLRYLAAWLAGTGAVALDGLMEDAATAEISRTQVWQWQRLGVELPDGTVVTRELVDRVVDEELARIRERLGESYRAQDWDEAVRLYRAVATSEDLADFLTLAAYERLP